LTSKTLYLDYFPLRSAEKKKFVNSEFNLKLGKIQCEGKINKQTKKNLRKSKLRRTDRKPELVEFKNSEFVEKWEI
jgi:hypothetical protein